MSDDKTALAIRLWWLPMRSLCGKVDLTVPPSFPTGRLESPIGCVFYRSGILHRLETSQTISSG
ncbi:uncharacterized protein BO66DRAFT_395647 [Aspergillus aculeatinus CBS 121060]|uniref:Uncharacterized protein n=1 Tax=Aspergillus aculeatinus CBS 121060 TaxID=1448322 RepID=A0ACD1GV86_9EURO|nr:hypothetical protein BO66DRAFT_395647 [Aspergillus aculeatinus CBS 121060]RAH65169.1 hypothetical protein BO66DRAFT_395647 [Aspergillus aculeatinus CBS 121060]